MRLPLAGRSPPGPDEALWRAGNRRSVDLTHKIEEIIQVDQADEQSVYAEITEYVATDSIREQYHDLLKAVADAPSDPMKAWESGCLASLVPAKVPLPRISATP